MSEHLGKNESRLTRKEKLLRRGLPAAIGATILGFGAYEAYEELNEKDRIGSTVESVQPDSNAIATVRTGVEEIAQTYDIDLADIPNSEIVHSGQEVGSEIREQTGEVLQPGDQIKIELFKTAFGDYDVEADPAQ